MESFLHKFIFKERREARVTWTSRSAGFISNPEIKTPFMGMRAFCMDFEGSWDT